MSPGGLRGDDGADEITVTAPDYRTDALRVFAVVFVVFSAGAVLSWSSFGSSEGPAFFYPSAGVTVATMMLTRRSLWPAVAAAIVAGEMLVDLSFGNVASMAAGYAVANVVEPLVGASLALAWCGGRPDLRKRSDFAAFLIGPCLIGPLFGALVGGTVNSVHDESGWLTAVLSWWAGDALGVLVVAAPIMLWANQSYVVRERPWETAAVLAITGGLSVAAFWAEAPPSLLMLPVLAWAALRLDMLGAALAGAVAAFLANIMATRDRGLFSNMDISLTARVALIQAFIAVIVVVAMLIAQEAAGRLSAVRERETERRERMRLETLSGLAQQLSAALSPADIGRALEEHVLNDAGATALSLGLLGSDGHTLEWVAMSGYPAEVRDKFGGGVPLGEPSVATEAVRSGRLIVVPTSSDYAARYPDNVHWSRLSGAESTVGAPLTSGGKPVGVLLLVWSDPQPLDDAQRAYISALATMVSQALVRARVYSDEHARAAVLQSAVLPHRPAESSGLDVCVTYEPADVAQGLGGDWYDVMALPGGRTYLAVGDVVGHGLPAVEDMAQLRSAGRALAHQGLSPAALLAELNGFTRHASQGKFATMAVVIFDPADGLLVYCAAGHPPPFLRRSATGAVTRLSGAGGPVLGPVPRAAYTEDTVRVDAGDILVMYTDGLVERRGRDIETGMSAAEQMIAAWDPDLTVCTCCEALQESLAPRPRDDDVCVVAVRFTAATPSVGTSGSAG